MGAVPTWTCAPDQTEMRPGFGQQIAWGESNAIVFANSVIGARTERYPDLLDLCCAITGRVPALENMSGIPHPRRLHRVRHLHQSMREQRGDRHRSGNIRDRSMSLHRMHRACQMPLSYDLGATLKL